MKIIYAIMLVLVPAILTAKYAPKEMFIIGWGDRPDEFIISHACHNYDLIDSSDYVEPGRGPNRAFVDINGNIIISSYYNQVKGFEKNGHLLFDFSSDMMPDYSQIFGNEFSLYIDSNQYIYSVPKLRNSINVINYSGEIVNRLYPFPDTINTMISLFKWCPNQKLYFKDRNYGWVTYHNGSFSRSGWLGMETSSGYCYRAFGNEDNPHTLFIGKYADIDSFGNPTYRNVKSIELEMSSCDTLYNANEILGGNGNNIYILTTFDSCDNRYNVIWIYDLDFNRIDELRLPEIDGLDIISPDPVVGPDNSIYEFRCLDDGLHVIKWTKQ